MKDFCW